MVSGISVMASVKLNSNDANAQTRLDAVKRTFTEVFALQVLEVKPIAYEEGFPFPYNNFVYAVSVDRSKPCEPSLPKKPGTQAIPPDETTFVIRLPNPVSGYNDEVRVENEVATLSLAREALQPSLSHLIPRVYGWHSAKNGEGWILQQHMPGEGLLDNFSLFSEDEKKNVLSQMADILACFQRFRLPSTINKYGGVGFNESGEYISTALSIFKAGPFATYQELLRATVTSKLAQADTDPRVKGWRENGIRERLDQFLTEGLSALLRNMPLAPDKVLTHADLSIDNVLYDSSSKKLTALFDFDFSYVGSVADEFFRSLGHDIGRFPSSRDEGEEIAELRNAMLSGFSDCLPSKSEEVDWIAAKAWNDALVERNLQRPATIPYIATLADVFWLSSQILPFKLCNEVVVGNSTDEQLKRRKADGEALLDEFLAHCGCK